MKQLLKLIIVPAVLLFNSSTVAQNYNDALLLGEPGLYTGARALAMGNSYTSLSNDISGLLFNPAGIGLVNKVELYGGMNFNSFNNNTSFFGTNTNASKSSVNLNQFGLVYPLPVIQGSWVFAFGYNRTKQFNKTLEFDGYNNNNNSLIQNLTGDGMDPSIAYDLYLSYYDSTDGLYKTLINGMLNQSGKIRKEGSIGKWAFASSIEVAKDFFIGGTFNIINGKYKSTSDYWEDDVNNIYDQNIQLDPTEPGTLDFQSFYLNDIIDWDLSGWDANLGILYNWKDRVKFGANVKFPCIYDIKETYYVNASSEFASFSADLNPIVDKIEYKIKTPFEYSFGASGNFSIITLAGDIKIMDYTQMEFTEGFDYAYRTARQKEIDDLFTTALDYHFGAEVKIPSLPILGRAGFMYLQSPYANDPSEFDKKYVTVGAGTLIHNTFGFDIAYAYGWWKDYGDNYGVKVSRTYQDINVNNLILNFSVIF
jgi:hypothetical protein